MTVLRPSDVLSLQKALELLETIALWFINCWPGKNQLKVLGWSESRCSTLLHNKPEGKLISFPDNSSNCFCKTETISFLQRGDCIELPRAPNCIASPLDPKLLRSPTFCWDSSRKHIFLVVNCRQNILKLCSDDWNIHSISSSGRCPSLRHKHVRISAQW